MKYLFLPFLWIATLATSQTSTPRLSKYFIDRSGHALYLPAKPNKVEISYSPDSSKVYTINCIDTTQKANFYFGAIVVDLKESIVGNEENILEKYLDYLKSNFKIKESAGYGKGHILETHPAAKGMIDYWRDEEGNEWKITGWADANTIVVMYEYGAKEYPIFNIVDLFMKGFRFKGDT